jgi:hypothetical protein
MRCTGRKLLTLSAALPPSRYTGAQRIMAYSGRETKPPVSLSDLSVDRREFIQGAGALYRKRDDTRLVDGEAHHPYLASYGYACIRPDIRGSGDSEGLPQDEYVKQEQDDGVEIIAWLAKQRWCTEKSECSASRGAGLVRFKWLLAIHPHSKRSSLTAQATTATQTMPTTKAAVSFRTCSFGASVTRRYARAAECARMECRDANAQVDQRPAGQRRTS